MNRLIPFALLATAALTGCSTRLALVSAEHQLPADGRDHRLATLTAPEAFHASGVPLRSLQVLRKGGNTYDLMFRTPVSPGAVRITVFTEKKRLAIPVTLTPDNAVTTDGTPDWMRLHSPDDRAAFRRWFTELAERAADAPAAKLPPEITDCASLLRYAYREALHAHDDKWYAQYPPDAMPAIASVEQWSYPNTPLGPALFRVRPGPFHATDLNDSTFAQFADAKTLHALNTRLVSRDVHAALPGDLIFYRVLETDSQYHSMIFTGEHGEWVVYHTGPINGGRGEMRRVLLADLLHHPDPQWRPQPNNPNFLGVYRWNILAEGQ